MDERLFLHLPDEPLHAAPTGVPPATLREFALPPALRATVGAAMGYDERLPDGVEVIERVLPDGALRLIFELDGPAPAATIAGPAAAPVLLRLRGHLRGLSLTLRPGAARALFGVPAHEFAEREVAWADVVPAAQRGLPERLHEAQDDAARIDLVLNALTAMQRDAPSPEQHLAQHAAALLRGAGEAAPLPALAARLGIGERRLQQVFRDQVGLPPRTCRRLARLHHCLRRLRDGPPAPWAALALDGGFYDQSHLINEFQSLCGLTPQQFLQRAVAPSSKTGG